MKKPSVAPGNAEDSELQNPSWTFRRVDEKWSWKGCGWCNANEAELRGLLKRLQGLESMTWMEVRKDGESHPVELHRLAKDARDRLQEIKADDNDTLFSLRITGRRRIWGIRDRSTLQILWWDPEHQVCPMKDR